MAAILELERSLDAVLSAPGPSKHAEALNALSRLRSYIGKSDSDDGEADSDTEAMALHCARLLFRQHTFPAHDAAENVAASCTDFAFCRPKRNQVHLRVGHYLRTSVACAAMPSTVPPLHHTPPSVVACVVQLPGTNVSGTLASGVGLGVCEYCSPARGRGRGNSPQ
ncbi:hypothetical protein BC826DRAFT_445126 [Russula brevipes]|nr:hypothetical protein BC826DRAFT_445126 [Russula brevipes]